MPSEGRGHRFESCRARQFQRSHFVVARLMDMLSLKRSLWRQRRFVLMVIMVMRAMVTMVMMLVIVTMEMMMMPLMIPWHDKKWIMWIKTYQKKIVLIIIEMNFAILIWLVKQCNKPLLEFMLFYEASVSQQWKCNKNTFLLHFVSFPLWVRRKNEMVKGTCACLTFPTWYIVTFFEVKGWNYLCHITWKRPSCMKYKCNYFFIN